MSSWILLDFNCRSCALTFESLERRADTPTSAPCPSCSEPAPRIISGTHAGTPGPTFQRGKSDPPPPHVVDTRPLAEGMSMRDWKAMRREKRRAARYAQIKRELS